jgi:hypothetical protein
VQEAIRAALVAFALADYQTEYPTVPLVTDNEPFDENDPPPHFVEFNVKFFDGQQISIAGEPRTRIKGYLYVTATIRQGRGSKLTLMALDWFSQKMGYSTMPGAGCRIILDRPEPESMQAPKGWFSEQVKFAFYADPT